MSKRKRIGLIILIVFLVIVAGLYVYLYLIPSISGSLTQTYIVEYGEVTTTDDTDCIVVRDEQVFYAEKTGSVTYYSEETEKTRKGFVVADIYAGNKYSMACPNTGYVSYYLDGYENYFTPDNIGTLEIDEYVNAELDEPYNSVRTDVSAGEAIYKLITSNTWYLLLVVPEDRLPEYTIGSSVTIDVAENKSIKASVDRFLGDGATRIVVCSTKDYYEDFAKIRKANVHVITRKQEGYFVPATAIEQKDDIQGVYVLGVDGEYVFKKVDVLDASGDLVLISSEGNVRLYDEILRNASDDKSN
ncbi:MAG: hypothetical protein MJ148_03845 [Clostridia bacterium]|nr:hypothetical protein [Clostridia bacterium]